LHQFPGKWEIAAKHRLAKQIEYHSEIHIIENQETHKIENQETHKMCIERKNVKVANEQLKRSIGKKRFKAYKN